MGRDIADGAIVKPNYGTAGFVHFEITDDDDEGALGQVLTSQGAGNRPIWADPDVPTSNATVNFQRFNSSGTWTKPAGLNGSSLVYVRVWHGGGSGQLGSSAAGGGGGGYVEAWFTLSQLGSTETVTIGAGGASRVGSNANGANGGLSSFGSLVTNGQAGGGGATGTGGDGGGPLTAPLGRIYHDITTPHYHGQGGFGGIAGNGGQSGVWHGGGGGSDTGTNSTFNAGSSVYAGGGGSGTNGTTAGTAGTSVNAGNGGAAGVNGANGTAGVQPAGGGGAAENTGGASSGAGGSGRVDVIVFGFPA